MWNNVYYIKLTYLLWLHLTIVKTYSKTKDLDSAQEWNSLNKKCEHTIN